MPFVALSEIKDLLTFLSHVLQSRWHQLWLLHYSLGGSHRCSLLYRSCRSLRCQFWKFSFPFGISWGITRSSTGLENILQPPSSFVVMCRCRGSPWEETLSWEVSNELIFLADAKPRTVWERNRVNRKERIVGVQYDRRQKALLGLLSTGHVSWF